jgi:hypothetical protein
VDIKLRPVQGSDPMEYLEQRADASGRHFRYWLERLAYGENEVRRLLKARSPYISIHEPRELKVTGAQSRLLFSTDQKP